jgi:RNA-binding protein YhbY
LAAVTAAVEEIVEKLNDRRVNKRGRTHIVLRGRKPAQK